MPVNSQIAETVVHQEDYLEMKPDNMWDRTNLKLTIPLCEKRTDGVVYYKIVTEVVLGDAKEEAAIKKDTVLCRQFVWRRFSEFEALHKQLKHVEKCTVLPKFINKVLVKNPQRRRTQLLYYLVSLCVSIAPPTTPLEEIPMCFLTFIGLRKLATFKESSGDEASVTNGANRSIIRKELRSDKGTDSFPAAPISEFRNHHDGVDKYVSNSILFLNLELMPQSIDQVRRIIDSVKQFMSDDESAILVIALVLLFFGMVLL